MDDDDGWRDERGGDVRAEHAGHDGRASGYGAGSSEGGVQVQVQAAESNAPLLADWIGLMKRVAVDACGRSFNSELLHCVGRYYVCINGALTLTIVIGMDGCMYCPQYQQQHYSIERAPTFLWLLSSRRLSRSLAGWRRNEGPGEATDIPRYLGRYVLCISPME